MSKNFVAKTFSRSFLEHLKFCKLWYRNKDMFSSSSLLIKIDSTKRQMPAVSNYNWLRNLHWPLKEYTWSFWSLKIPVKCNFSVLVLLLGWIPGRELSGSRSMWAVQPESSNRSTEPVRSYLPQRYKLQKYCQINDLATTVEVTSKFFGKC